MNDETKVPFFINTKRRQSAESYFEIGRTQDKLRKLLEQKRNSNVIVLNDEDWEEYGKVGCYGVSRFIKLDDEGGEGDGDDFVDEDVHYANTNSFQLFWMTFKNIASSIGQYFSSTKNARPSDLEFNQPVVEDSQNHEALYKVLVDPSFNNPSSKLKQDVFVYGDVNYLIQKFRVDLRRGSVDVALFSVELPNSDKHAFPTDLQTFVVSPECGSYVWIENGTASAIFVTKSTDDFFGSVLEWFRKILSDMALADSVMIGHPYYWHPNVRRRLTRVMRYLKRLYRTLALREKKNSHCSKERISTNQIEVICPPDVSKIIIKDQPSTNLLHSTSNYGKLTIMLEHLVKKWFDYQCNVRQSNSDNLSDITTTYSVLNSPQPSQREPRDFLESVTFLDFFSQERVVRSGSRLRTNLSTTTNDSDNSRDETCPLTEDYSDEPSRLTSQDLLNNNLEEFEGGERTLDLKDREPWSSRTSFE